MPVEATPFVKKHSPWSASKADTAETCPLKFRFAYVNKVSKGRPSKEALVGTTLHKILELSLKDGILDAAVKCAMEDPKVRLLTIEKQEIEAQIPNISTFLTRTLRFIEKQGGAKLLIEEKIAASYENTPRKFFDNTSLFRGVVDVGILFDKQPHLMVIDHKTGKNRGIDYYSWQFLTYTYMAKVAYPHLTHVIPAIHWVQDGYTETGKAIAVPDVQKLQDDVITHLNRVTVEASDCLDKGKPSKLCGWCDYGSLCPLLPEDVKNGKKGDE